MVAVQFTLYPLQLPPSQSELWMSVSHNRDGDDRIGKGREVVSVLQGEICVSSKVISVRTQRIFLFIIHRECKRKRCNIP